MAPAKVPRLGSTVLCDGELCVLNRFLGEKPKSRSLMDVGTYEDAIFIVFEGPLRRHKTAKLEGDVVNLRWDKELEVFYMWGRILSCEQKAKVIDLRDRGKLAARETRNPGNAPAAGEHMNLYKALFAVPGPIDDARIAAYAELFAAPLTEGYARRDADDSPAEMPHRVEA